MMNVTVSRVGVLAVAGCVGPADGLGWPLSVRCNSPRWPGREACTRGGLYGMLAGTQRWLFGSRRIGDAKRWNLVDRERKKRLGKQAGINQARQSDGTGAP